MRYGKGKDKYKAGGGNPGKMGYRWSYKILDFMETEVARRPKRIYIILLVCDLTVLGASSLKNGPAWPYILFTVVIAMGAWPIAYTICDWMGKKMRRWKEKRLYDIPVCIYVPDRNPDGLLKEDTLLDDPEGIEIWESIITESFDESEDILEGTCRKESRIHD